MRRGLFAGLTLILTAVPLAVLTSLPAQAAYGVCNADQWRNVGTNEYVKVPVRTGNGMSCYMGYQQGSNTAVVALQQAIELCYPNTPAADYIEESGGADGVYGTGTVKAVRWVQANRLGFEGNDVDGVYGPATRSAMRWPVYRPISGGYLFQSCRNPTQI
ncbi:peptidoglycan-binding protein [Kribbella sp. NPDC058245]|uniref:peptidoglycan-binding domain-containing protein n=1 Tax=Kribbella sp. NPDC058245 TaxID=3346399 RepID=UPI0036E35B59